MRRVGGESAELGERGFDPGQGQVVRPRQMTQFVVRVLHRQALAEVVGGQPLGVAGHAFEWLQGAARQPVARKAGDQDGGGKAERYSGEELAPLVMEVLLADAHADHDVAAADGMRLAEHAQGRSVPEREVVDRARERDGGLGTAKHLATQTGAAIQ